MDLLPNELMLALPKIYKGPTLVKSLTGFLCHCWNDGDLPQDLKDARIVHLYKGKGDRSSCDNYRGISLMSIAGKILSKVILNRLNKHLLDKNCVRKLVWFSYE